MMAAVAFHMHKNKQCFLTVVEAVVAAAVAAVVAAQVAAVVIAVGLELEYCG